MSIQQEHLLAAYANGIEDIKAESVGGSARKLNGADAVNQFKMRAYTHRSDGPRPYHDPHATLAS
jgi:hypothetical protein